MLELCYPVTYIKREKTATDPVSLAGKRVAFLNNNLCRGETFVFFGPEHAATVARDGFGKLEGDCNGIGQPI